MPEGPEIKIYTQRLSKRIKNKILKNIEFLSGRYVNKEPLDKNYDKFYPKNFNKFKSLLPCLINEINCKGKFQYWLLDNCNLNNPTTLINTIWITHGMSGYFTTKKTKHSHIKFTFCSFTLFFTDVRRFGTIKFESCKDLQKKLNSLGPDILESISDEVWINIFKKKSEWSIAKILMNQKYISGIGNYIKAEALYFAKINPWKKANEIPKKKLLKLKKIIQEIAITSFKNNGVYFHCYGRKITDKNEVIITEKTDDKRTTYWVPKIQR